MSYPSLQKHSKWEYSKQVWYKKYHIAIDIGYQSRYGNIRLPNPNDDTANYRSRQRYSRKGIVTTVYTDSEQYAKQVLNYYKNKIVRLRSPSGDEHLEALQNDHNIESRDTLYHGKYRFKVHTYKNFKHGFDRDTWTERCIEVNKWIDDNFKKSRTQRQFAWFYPYIGSSYEDVKFIYTNDESTLMLYKMAFGNYFNISVTEAFIP